MESEVPTLTGTDVERVLERIFARERRAPLAAIRGRGEAGSISCLGRMWDVVPTQCELELRAKMPVAGTSWEAGDPGKVFLVDWTDASLPLDIGCRLAGGRLHRVARGTRLAAIFGARQAAPGLVGSHLAAVLLSGEVQGLPKVTGLTVGRDQAYRGFLEAWLGFPAGVELTDLEITAWCAQDERGPGLVARAGAATAWAGLRDELRAWIEAQAGPLAGLAWRAWEVGTGTRFLELAVLIDAAAQADDAAATGLLHGLAGSLGEGYGEDLVAMKDQLRSADLLGRTLGSGRLSGSERAALLDDADALVTQHIFEVARRASEWLPTGHAAREELLGKALLRVVANPTVKEFDKLRTALQRVETHQQDRTLREEPAQKARMMAVRLAAWLVARATRRDESTLGPEYDVAMRLAGRFVEEGGYVDWCRQTLRGPLPFSSDVSAAMHAVLKAVDAERSEDNRHFASGLVKWIEAGRPSMHVTPIEHVTRQFVQELLEGTPRRALVVLMDGMSWASAVQLLERLKGDHWAPIVWRPKGHEAARYLPPVLASLPTLTPVSRASFFAGKGSKTHGDRPTADDVGRWAANKWLQKAADGEAPAPLVMKSQLMEGEALSADVRKAIEGEQRVVGVIVNAIDDDLKGSRQTLKDYSQVAIQPLAGLLSAAAGAERVVLLASDHGHVPGNAMTKLAKTISVAKEGARRWRALNPGDELREEEIRLPADTWRPKQREGVAAIWDEHASNGGACYGEHGGVSLPEVVAPALWIAPDWLHQAVDWPDREALATRAYPEPGWWRLSVAPAATQEPPVSANKKKASEPTAQLALIPPVAPPSPKPAAVTGHHPLAKALADSKVFKGQVAGVTDVRVKRALEVVGVLAAAGDQMGEAEFAAALGIPSFKLRGVVSQAGVVNMDGQAFIVHDRDAKQVRLERSNLELCYGVSA